LRRLALTFIAVGLFVGAIALAACGPSDKPLQTLSNTDCGGSPFVSSPLIASLVYTTASSIWGPAYPQIKTAHSGDPALKELVLDANTLPTEFTTFGAQVYMVEEADTLARGTNLAVGMATRGLGSDVLVSVAMKLPSGDVLPSEDDATAANVETTANRLLPMAVRVANTRLCWETGGAVPQLILDFSTGSPNRTSAQVAAIRVQDYVVMVAHRSALGRGLTDDVAVTDLVAKLAASVPNER
jgi:hypothetical protein